MKFTDEPLTPFGQVLLAMDLENDLGLKTALVYRLVKTLQQHHLLPPYGCQLAEVCFEEVLANAIIHGNKLDLTKRVKVQLFTDNKRWGLIVEDEGAGFTPAQVPTAASAEDDLFRDRGRGIMLMEHYMSDVAYNRTGNRVRMVRAAQLEPDEGSAPPAPDVFMGESLPADGKIDLSDLTLPADLHPEQLEVVVLPDEIELAAPPEPAAPTEEPPAGPIWIREKDGVCLATVQAKRISEDNAATVRVPLIAAADKAPRLVLDISQVEFMSSVGISTIMATYKAVKAHKGQLVLAGMQPAIKNIFGATGLLKAFIMEPDVPAAIKKAKG